ncbi:ras family-domain-containing protein [Linnemannia elongata]|nr:ras family-domain-containing protein [Linnemannia elongata]
MQKDSRRGVGALRGQVLHPHPHPHPHPYPQPHPHPHHPRFHTIIFLLLLQSSCAPFLGIGAFLLTTLCLLLSLSFSFLLWLFFRLMIGMEKKNEGGLDGDDGLFLGIQQIFCRSKQRHNPTVFENFVTDVKIDGKPVQLALWDTAGQEAYERLRPLSYTKAHVILIGYSVDTPDSLDNVTSKWIQEVQFFPRLSLSLTNRKKNKTNGTDQDQE